MRGERRRLEEVVSISEVRRVALQPDRNGDGAAKSRTMSAVPSDDASSQTVASPGRTVCDTMLSRRSSRWRAPSQAAMATDTVLPPRAWGCRTGCREGSSALTGRRPMSIGRNSVRYVHHVNSGQQIDPYRIFCFDN